MALKTRRPARKRKRVRSRRLPGLDWFRQIVLGNTLVAVKDESYALVQRIAEEVLKDPKIVRISEEWARELLRKLTEMETEARRRERRRRPRARSSRSA